MWCRFGVRGKPRVLPYDRRSSDPFVSCSWRSIGAIQRSDATPSSSGSRRLSKGAARTFSRALIQERLLSSSSSERRLANDSSWCVMSSRRTSTVSKVARRTSTGSKSSTEASSTATTRSIRSERTEGHADVWRAPRGECRTVRIVCSSPDWIRTARKKMPLDSGSRECIYLRDAPCSFASNASASGRWLINVHSERRWRHARRRRICSRSSTRSAVVANAFAMFALDVSTRTVAASVNRARAWKNGPGGCRR